MGDVKRKRAQSQDKGIRDSWATVASGALTMDDLDSQHIKYIGNKSGGKTVAEKGTPSSNKHQETTPSHPQPARNVDALIKPKPTEVHSDEIPSDTLEYLEWAKQKLERQRNNSDPAATVQRRRRLHLAEMQGSA